MRQYLSRGSNYGKLVLLTGILAGLPLLVLPFYPSEIRFASAFVIPMIFSLVLGMAICVKTYQGEENATEWRTPWQRASLPVLFGWCYSFVIGAVPFVIAGKLDLFHALFESVSGWTTTGLSVVDDVASLPHIFLFHRSFMQYCGGLGFVLMMVMLVHGKQSVNMYNAEGHLDRLLPNLRQTARIIFALYSGLLVAGALLYALFGMSVFDAVCYAMSSISTAGFATQAGGIGMYGSLPIEIVTIGLMLIGASNFTVLLLLMMGKVRQALRVTEVKFMFGILAVCALLTTVLLIVKMDMGFGESLRSALFGVVAAFSTTGYAITNYAEWTPAALGLLILLMMIGGSAGSTAGGIKLTRAYFVMRITRENIRRRLSSAYKVAVPSYETVRGKVHIDEALTSETFSFMACFLGVLMAGTLLLALAADCSLFDAMFEFASVLSTSGIASGLVHSGTNAPTLLVEMAGMVLGRLEVLIVFVGLASGIHALRMKLPRKTS